jgi:hypothetical protein
MNDPGMAKVTFYTSVPGVFKKWGQVLPGSTTRNSDGSFSFKHRDNLDGKMRRATIAGVYVVEYPFDETDR